MATTVKNSRLSARRCKKSVLLQGMFNLEQIEQRLVLSTVSSLVADVATPRVLSVSLPTPKTYGTGSALTFKLNFNQPVQVVGNKANVFVPVEESLASRWAIEGLIAFPHSLIG